MALTANARISLMARGARFLKLMPWIWGGKEGKLSSIVSGDFVLFRFSEKVLPRWKRGEGKAHPFMQIDGVFPGDHVADGGALLRRFFGGRSGRRLGFRHFFFSRSLSLWRSRGRGWSL